MADGPRTRLDIGLEELETFLKVVDCTSFSMAARELNLSQPSISNRVRRLEEKLSVRLLHRSTRKVELTPEGKRLYDEATDTLRGLRRLCEEFDKETNARRRHVDVAAGMMISTMVLPPVASEFGRRYPTTELRIRNLLPDQAVQLVVEGRCDMAIVGFGDQPPNMPFELLAVDTCVVVTPKGHPLARRPTAVFEDLISYPLLTPDVYAPVQQAVAAEAERRHCVPHFATTARESGNIMTCLAMVAAGLGVCLHPGSLIPPELRSVLDTVPLADFTVQRKFGIIRSAEQDLSLAARRFRDVVRGMLGNGRWMRQNVTSSP